MLAREAPTSESEIFDRALRLRIGAGMTIADYNTAMIGVSTLDNFINLYLHSDDTKEHQVAIVMKENGNVINLFAPANRIDMEEYFGMLS